MCRWKRIDADWKGRLLSVSLAFLLGAAGATVAWGQSPRSEGDQALEELLQRLQLVELQMLHLEQRVAAAGGSERIAIAKRLADVYATQLLDAEGDAAELLREKIRQLISAAPEADTAKLGVVLLQARFQEAEANAIQWLQDHDTEARDKAQAELRELAPNLARRQKTLRADVRKLEDRLDQARSTRAEQQLTTQLEGDTVLMLRATFLSGWANYYEGLLNQNRTSLLTAKTMFQQLLGMDDDTDGDLSAQWLGLEAPARARSLIGLAMTETALDNKAAAERLFALLADPIVAPEIQDQAGQWQVRALLNLQQLALAREAAAKLIGQFDGRSTPGKAQLCSTLVQTGFAKGSDGNVRDAKLATLGLRGLAKMGEFRLLRQLLEKQGVSLAQLNGISGDSFYLRWLAAQQTMEEANESKETADYAAAVEKFKLALAADLSTADPKPLAQCRNEYAWCLYHAKQWRQSGDVYREAAEDLLTLGEREAAEKGMWMAFVAYQHGDSDSLEASAKQTLETLARQFPDSEYGRKAKYQLAKMTGSAASQLADLERVPKGDPQYLAARFDVCTIRHQLWQGARGTATEGAEARATVQAVETYLKEAGEADKRLRAALLGIEAAADGRPPQPAALGRLLSAGADASEGQAPALQATFHYQYLRWSLGVGNRESARQHAEWLVTHPAGEPYRQTALVALAKAADTELANAKPSERDAALQRAENAYARLSQQLGDSPEVLAGNRNAQVALYKTAEFQLQRQQVRAAAENFAKLLQVAPKSRVFIRGSARASFANGEFAQSLPHWRSLLRASQDGDDAWYEAKYHQIACLLETDPEAAKKVLQQFNVLHPELPAKWKPRFAMLQ